MLPGAALLYKLVQSTGGIDCMRAAIEFRPLSFFTTVYNISARLLKDSASVISASLTRLFNLSLETRTFPSLWKFGKVAALFKKGDRCDANNHRPITVLPTISKIQKKPCTPNCTLILRTMVSLHLSNLGSDRSYQLEQP